MGVTEDLIMFPIGHVPKIKFTEDECAKGELHLIRGQWKTVREFSEQYGIKLNTIWNRIQMGWDLEEALFTPLYCRRKRN